MTRYQNPPPVLWGNGPGLRSLLNECIGDSFSEVRYASFEGSECPSLWERRRNDIEPVDMAVALRLSRRWIRVDWAAPSITAGLSVLVSDTLEFAPWGVMDATCTAAWSECHDRSLSSYELAWFTAETGAEEAFLAVRLTFGHIARAIILGELGDAGVDYLPDALAVVTNQDLASIFHWWSDDGRTVGCPLVCC